MTKLSTPTRAACESTSSLKAWYKRMAQDVENVLISKPPAAGCQSRQSSASTTAPASDNESLSSSDAENEVAASEAIVRKTACGQLAISHTDLLVVMEKEASSMQTWDAEKYRQGKNLMDVHKTRSVDLMESLNHGSMAVAVKRMSISWVGSGPKEFQEKNPTASERPWVEIGIMKILQEKQFPFSCAYLGTYRDAADIRLVAEYAQGGDLFTWCEQAPGVGPSREEAMHPITVQVCSSVCWLHDLNIVHRDISLENFVLAKRGDQKPQVKLIDFGMASVSRHFKDSVRGKKSYQAPEVHGGKTYDAFQTDAFAVGVVLFALATFDYPWGSTQPNKCPRFDFVMANGFSAYLERRKVRNGNGACLIEVLSPSLTKVLEGLLQFRPAARLSLGESCWKQNSGKQSKESVWTTEWMRQHGSHCT